MHINNTTGTQYERLALHWLGRHRFLSEPVFAQVLPRHCLLTDKATNSNRKDPYPSLWDRVHRCWNRGHADRGHADSKAHSFTLLGEHKHRNRFSPEDKHGGVVWGIAENYSGLVNEWSWRT